MQSVSQILFYEVWFILIILVLIIMKERYSFINFVNNFNYIFVICIIILYSLLLLYFIRILGEFFFERTIYLPNLRHKSPVAKKKTRFDCPDIVSSVAVLFSSLSLCPQYIINSGKPHVIYNVKSRYRYVSHKNKKKLLTNK